MVITKREDVTKQGFWKILWRKLCLQGSLLLELIQENLFKFGGVGGGKVGGVGVDALLSLSWIGSGEGCGGRLFEGGRLLTFSAFRIGAYSRWALIRGWALIRINTITAFMKESKKRRFNMRSKSRAAGLPHYRRERTCTALQRGENIRLRVSWDPNPSW